MESLPRITRKSKNSQSPAFPSYMEMGKTSEITPVEQYVQFLESKFNVSSKTSHSPVDAIMKGLAAPPQEFSYARITSMPDMYNDGVMQWPDLSPQAFRKVVQTNLAPQMIIGNRIDDVLAYARPSTQPYMPGWRILPRDGSTTMGDATKREIRDAERFLLQCNTETGWDARKRDVAGYQGWTTFLSSIVRDSLTYDAVAIFTDMDQKGRVKGFKALSAGNISLTGKDGYKGKKDIFAVGQDESGNVCAEFTRDQLIWFVRNPRTDPTIGGYGYSEIFITIKLIGGLTNALDLNLSVFDRNCYVEDTEILTKNGWRYFNELNQEQDEFVTLNLNTNNLEYQKATQLIWDEYEGDVYQLKSPSLDLVVTPNHRILYEYMPKYRATGKHSYEIATAEELYKKFNEFTPESRHNYGIPVENQWEGIEVQDKEFEYGVELIGGTQKYEKHKKEGGVPTTIKMSGDDYCAFMGMYLSEGSLTSTTGSKNTLAIYQKTCSKGFIPFKEVLDRIFEKEVWHNDEKFQFECKGLAEHIKQFGDHAWNKHIPQEILNATPRQQQIFLDFYIMGDGTRQSTKTTNKRNTRNNGYSTQITTTSAKLADQFQEITQKLGYSTSIRTYTMDELNKYSPTINKSGTPILNKRSQYRLTIRNSRFFSFDLEKTTYKGHIGCVTVPNGIIYVRRNGKPCWSGNSVPNGMLLLKGMGWTQRQLDILARLWTDLKQGATKAWALPAVALPEGAEVEMLDLSSFRNDMTIYYADFMNFATAAFCMIYRFPYQRLGYRSSGVGKGTEMPNPSNPSPTDDVDIGKAPLLGHIETIINEYLLWTRWPDLHFHFTGKNPKEDNREFEFRVTSMTWAEKRVASGLPPLEKMIDKKYADLAQLMGMAPVDPSLSGIYQNMLSAYIKNDSEESPERLYPSKKDPAQSAEHGHQSGVRRDSQAEDMAAEEGAPEE